MPSARDHRDLVATIVGERVIAALRAEGRIVENIGRPDRENRTTRAPDFAATVDGVETAIEITEFAISADDTRGQVEVARWTRRLGERLSPIARDRGLGLALLSISYHPPAVPSRRRFDVEAEPLVRRIERAMLSMQPAAERRERIIRHQLGWLRGQARLVVLPQLRPRFDVLSSPGAHLVTGRVVDFLRRTNLAKASQVAEYPQAVLVVINWLLAAPDDYREPLRQEPGPWWRAYVVTQGGHVHAVLGD